LIAPPKKEEEEEEEEMQHPPTLNTERLILRPFSIADADEVQKLAGAKEIYATTANVPHPYEDGMAEKWISTHASNFYNDLGVNLAITERIDRKLIGAIGLGANRQHYRAELGYWIGYPYWRKGYCTEAALELIRYGFEQMKYHKITARHMESNPASGRVMEKAGMKKEGILLDDIYKDGKYQTTIVYGIINPASAE
jgi:RimJ/RimL family protein N-acetyltransferase